MAIVQHSLADSVNRITVGLWCVVNYILNKHDSVVFEVGNSVRETSGKFAMNVQVNIVET